MRAGELKEVGHRVASTTIAIVLKTNGIEPAPDRPSSWKTFFKAHWGQVAATDFFGTVRTVDQVGMPAADDLLR